MKLLPLINTKVQNKVKNNFTKKIFNKLSRKSTLIEETKLPNNNKYIKIVIVWNMILKVGECKIFKSDNKPVRKIKKTNIVKYL